MARLMPRLRRLALFALVLAALGAFAAPHALAAPLPSCPPNPALPRQMTTPHFLVGYEDDSTKPEYMNQSSAGTVAAAAERAYASFTADGFPAPMVAGSGKTELYIMDLTQWGLAGIGAPGCVVLDKTSVTGDLMDYHVGTAVFTEVEYQIGGGALWLMNGFGGWASWRALGYPAASIDDIGPFDVSLDCASAADKANCSQVGFENLGESRWPFYEYLTEKYGPLFVVDVYNAVAAAAAGGAPSPTLQGLQDALTAKGTTLGVEYGAYAAKLLSGGWSAATLSAATIPVTGSPIQTGASSGAIPTASLGINHLATKYVEIDRGDGSADHACYAATLTLNVKIPSGVTSQPVFYWSGGGSAPVSLTVSGQTATATVPWDTCKWSTKGYLGIPNTSFVDGTSFVVSGTITVDFSTPASAVLPPAASSPYGPIVSVGSISQVPTLSLFGPATLKLADDAKQLRLAVRSSGDGSVRVALGATTLGTVVLAAGGNNILLTIPPDLLRSLPATGVVTLTPLAPDGKTGTDLTRPISITAIKQSVKHTSLTKVAKKTSKKASKKTSKKRTVRPKS
jgi:hypothetical protein